MSVLAVGDNITDYYLDRAELFPGGNSMNVAVSVARAGGRSACLGAVGDDARGRQIVTALTAEGVEVDRLRREPGATALVVVRHVAGERRFSGRVDGVRFTPDRADLDYAAGFSAVHTSFCAGIETEVPRFAAVARVSFDFNGHICDDYAEGLIGDVWFAQFSAEQLSSGQCRELIDWAHARGTRWVLVTRGAQGALLSDGRRTLTAAAIGGRPVDTLGAGDACIGRILHGLVAGEPTDRVLPAAMRAAGEACATLGAFGHGLPASEFAADPAIARASLAETS